jgi:protein-S-isoprenylcysteine O-methyltransferase Ste14
MQLASLAAFPGLKIFIFLITFFAWMMAEGANAKRDKQRPQTKSTLKDRGSKTTILVAVYIGMISASIFAVFFTGADVNSYSPYIFALGIAMVWVGIYIRETAVKTLGNNFTTVVIVERNQKVINSGLYRYVRHPSYTGALITMLGFGLSFTNVLSFAACFIPVLIAIINRIGIEERALKGVIGKPYLDYAQATNYRLIPLIW